MSTEDDRFNTPEDTDGKGHLIMANGVGDTTEVTVGPGVVNLAANLPGGIIPAGTRYLHLAVHDLEPEDPVIGSATITLTKYMRKVGRGQGKEVVLEGTRRALKTFCGRASAATKILVTPLS